MAQPRTIDGRRVQGQIRCHVCLKVIGYHLAPREGELFGTAHLLRDVIGKAATYPNGTGMLRCKEHEHISGAEWWPEFQKRHTRSKRS